MAEQSNITLRIDAVDGGAEQALLDTERAERKLEVAVRAGNKTTRERVSNEADLAKVLQKIEDGEKKAATAGQRRAAASLQAQRSAALYRQHLEELAAAEAKRERQARMADGWDQARARAMADAASKTEARTRAIRGNLDSSSTAADGLAGRLGRVAAVTATIGAAAQAAAAEFEGLMNRAGRANSRAASMKDFIQALPPGAEGDALRNRTISIGASFGLTPDQAAQVAGPILAAADKDGDGSLKGREMAAYKGGVTAASMLRAAGVSPEDAANVLLAGENRGVSPMKTASALLKASAISMRGPGVFSKSASAISQFDDLDTGLAVTTAISKSELNEGRIQERVKDVQLALSSAADTSEFSKRHGLAGLSQGEKIAKLRAAAMASGDAKRFTDAFQTQGLDEGKALSLAMLVQQGDLYSKTAKTLATMEPGFAASVVRGLRQNSVTANTMAQEQAVAALAANDMIGPKSGRSARVFAGELALANRLQQFGGDEAVDPATGLPKSIDLSSWAGARGSWDRIRGTMKAFAGGMPMMGAPDASELAETNKALIRALETNNRLLEGNNTATEANTTRLGRGRAVGGAASNAEESR